MRETEWTGKLLAHAGSIGAVYLSLVGGQGVEGRHMQAPGWPDRYLCHALWQGWVEFKGRRTPIEPLQRKRMEELNVRAPGLAWVVRMGMDDELTALIQRPSGDYVTHTRGRDYRQLLASIILHLDSHTPGNPVRQGLSLSDVQRSREALWRAASGT